MKTTTRRFGPSAIDRTVSNWPRIDPRGAQALMYANIGDFKHLFDWYRQWRKPIEARFASSVVVTLWPGSQQGRQHPQVFFLFFSVRHGFSATHLFRGKKKMFWWFFSQFFFCFLRTERGFRLFFPNWRRSSSIRLPSHSFSPALTGVVLGANRRPRRFRILRRDKTRETRKMNGGKRLTRRRLSWSCPSFAETNSCPDAWLAVPAVIYRRRKTQDSEREIINSPAHRKTSTLFSSLPTLLHPRLVLIWRGPSRWLIYTKQQLVLGIGHSHKIGSGRWRARALPTWAVPCLVRIR